MITQLGSHTLRKLLDADNDVPSNDFFDDGHTTEISISADGYFGEMKKTETPSKRWRVGRYPRDNFYDQQAQCSWAIQSTMMDYI